MVPKENSAELELVRRIEDLRNAREKEGKSKVLQEILDNKLQDEKYKCLNSNAQDMKESEVNHEEYRKRLDDEFTKRQVAFEKLHSLESEFSKWESGL
jgi:hypothetical protein